MRLLKTEKWRRSEWSYLDATSEAEDSIYNEYGRILKCTAYKVNGEDYWEWLCLVEDRKSKELFVYHGWGRKPFVEVYGETSRKLDGPTDEFREKLESEENLFEVFNVWY